MAVHFQRSTQTGAQQPSSAVADTVQNQLQQLTPTPRNADLGFWGNRKLKKAQREVALEDERRKLEIDSREAIATYGHGVKLNGVAIRTALSRIYGDVIVAEMQAMGECHAAAVQAQKVSSMSASLFNLLSKNEHITEVRQLADAGKISAADATAMINQVIDWHVDCEERLAVVNHAIAQTTDRVYMSGLAPVDHSVNQR